MAQQPLAQGDAALDAFDRLRVRELKAKREDTFSTFLASFQSAAASLEPDERIKLEVVYARQTMEFLKAVLVDPQASKVCFLYWWYSGKEDVNSIIPLLLSSCPELASLQVNFQWHSAFDFVSSVLEHPSSKIKVLEMPEYVGGNIPRFFAALEQSQVSALALFKYGLLEFEQGLREYLAKDLLVRLKLWIDMTSLADCTRLTELEMRMCKFLQPTAFTHLSKSITKLELNDCKFADGFDWSFLVGSGVRELYFFQGEVADGSLLGSALAAHLRANGLDELRFIGCDFVNENLAAVGLELGRIKRLEVKKSYLDDAFIELIALALQSPNSEMKELVLLYDRNTASSFENHLVPALKHPNCSLAKLGLYACQEWSEEDEEYEELEAAAEKLEDEFRNRRALFVLLQGQQVRRVYCPLRRLPVEMFRLVGEVLL